MLLVNYFFCPPLPPSNVESTENDWTPDINIASGEGGEGKYVIFTGLLPLCPKSFDQGCSYLRIEHKCNEIEENT